MRIYYMFDEEHLPSRVWMARAVPTQRSCLLYCFTWQPCSELAVLGAQLSGFILCGSSFSMQGNVAFYGWRLALH